jgi:hypothetical protein
MAGRAVGHEVALPTGEGGACLGDALLRRHLDLSLAANDIGLLTSRFWRLGENLLARLRRRLV